MIVTYIAFAALVIGIALMCSAWAQSFVFKRIQQYTAGHSSAIQFVFIVGLVFLIIGLALWFFHPGLTLH